MYINVDAGARCTTSSDQIDFETGECVKDCKNAVFGGATILKVGVGRSDFPEDGSSQTSAIGVSDKSDGVIKVRLVANDEAFN